MGRPRGTPANHHLKVRDGVWIFRWTRGGRDTERSTECPRSEVAAARKIRDKWMAGYAAQRFGVEEIPPARTLDEVVRLYLDAASKEYDRDKGGEQDGAKRGAAGDRSMAARLRQHLDFSLPADRIDRERLLDAATAMREAGRIVRTKNGPKRSGDLAGFTVRNMFRFLQTVYAWAAANSRKTGVVASPFDQMKKGSSERKRLFPRKVTKKAPPFTRDELRALWDSLPAHAYRPARFDAQTGMRWWSELLRMEWGRVDFERRTYTVDPRWAKRGKERDVLLNDVALEILRHIRPENPAPQDPVWVNSGGEPLKDARDVISRRVKKVCAAPRPGYRYPDLHSFRRTTATALERAGAPRSVIRKVLGHSAEEDVTASYITATDEDCLVWLNRAARLIDGDTQENVVPLVVPTKTGVKTGRVVESNRASDGTA